MPIQPSAVSQNPHFYSVPPPPVHYTVLPNLAIVFVIIVIHSDGFLMRDSMVLISENLLTLSLSIEPHRCQSSCGLIPVYIRSGAKRFIHGKKCQ